MVLVIFGVAIATMAPLINTVTALWNYAQNYAMSDNSYGTGFGPYAGNAPDGFALSADPSFLLVDPVTLVAGDAEVQTTYAGAAAGKVGVNAVSFVISEALPTGTNVPVKMRINGHESNVVILPMK